MRLVSWFVCCSLSFLLAAGAVVSQEFVYADKQVERFVAQIELNTAEELAAVLRKAEQLAAEPDFDHSKHHPVAFVLHGPEAEVLLSHNYRQNKSLVDLAASLSALNIIDVKVCKTWMGGRELDESQLLPFVGTVPYGPGELQRLMKDENYVYF